MDFKALRGLAIKAVVDNDNEALRSCGRRFVQFARENLETALYLEALEMYFLANDLAMAREVLKDAGRRLPLAEQGPLRTRLAGLDLERAQQLVPPKQQMQVQFMHANALLEADRFSDALPFFQKLVRDHPGFAEAHVNQGICFRNLGRLAFDAGLRLQPALHNAYWHKGKILRPRANGTGRRPSFRLWPAPYHQKTSWDGTPRAELAALGAH